MVGEVRRQRPPRAHAPHFAGKRGIRDVWQAALLCGGVFGLFQFLASNYISVPLADIFAALLSAGAVVLLVRVWSPAGTYVDTDQDEPVTARGGVATA